MDPISSKIAGDLALQGSGWAVAMLFLAGIVYLGRRLEARTTEFVEVISDVIAALQASTTASNGNALALESLRSVMETRGTVMEGISRQIEGVARSVDQESERIRERQTEILQRLPEILKRLPGGRS